MLWRTTSNSVRVWVLISSSSPALSLTRESFMSSSFNKINGGWRGLTFTAISLCAYFNCTHLPCRCLLSFLCLTRLWQLWEAGACFYMWKAPLMNSCLSRGEITGQSILQLLRIEEDLYIKSSPEWECVWAGICLFVFALFSIQSSMTNLNSLILILYLRIFFYILMINCEIPGSSQSRADFETVLH